MQVWTLWFGGASYSPPENADLEMFETLTKAVMEFHDRTMGRGHFHYVDKPHESFTTPAVPHASADVGGPSMVVYLRDPREEWDSPGGDAYPDRLVEYGPHGAVRITPC